MRYFVQMSFKEIADNTGVSINTSLGRMRYALINLRKIIQDKKLILSSQKNIQYFFFCIVSNLYKFRKAYGMKTTKPLYNKKVTEPSDETIMNIKSFARNYFTCYSSTLKKNINWLESQFTKLASANISANISIFFIVYLLNSKWRIEKITQFSFFLIT